MQGQRKMTFLPLTVGPFGHYFFLSPVPLRSLEPSEFSEKTAYFMENRLRGRFFMTSQASGHCAISDGCVIDCRSSQPAIKKLGRLSVSEHSVRDKLFIRLLSVWVCGKKSIG